MQIKVLFILILLCIVLLPMKAKALASTDSLVSSVGVSRFVQIQECGDTLLGDPKDENSVAWLIQQVLDVIKIVGPIFVVILSSIDFVGVIMNGDDQAMAKAQKKLIIRLILAACLFLLPYLVTVLLDIFGLTTSGVCGMS